MGSPRRSPRGPKGSGPKKVGSSRKRRGGVGSGARRRDSATTKKTSSTPEKQASPLRVSKGTPASKKSTTRTTTPRVVVRAVVPENRTPSAQRTLKRKHLRESSGTPLHEMFGDDENEDEPETPRKKLRYPDRETERDIDDTDRGHYVHRGRHEQADEGQCDDDNVQGIAEEGQEEGKDAETDEEALVEVELEKDGNEAIVRSARRPPAANNSHSSHVARDLVQDSNTGVLRTMKVMLKTAEKQRLSSHKELIEAVRTLSSNLSAVDRRLAKCADAVNIVLLSTALPKKGKAVEKASLNDILRPMDDIFAGKFMYIMFLRSLMKWAMRDVPWNTGPEDRNDAVEAVHLGARRTGCSSSDAMNHGMLLIETLLWKRDPNEEKSELLLGTPQARQYHVLRKVWAKSLIITALMNPNIGTRSLEAVTPFIRGNLERTEKPFWLRRGFANVSQVESCIEDEFAATAEKKARRVQRSKTDKRFDTIVGDAAVRTELIRRVFKLGTQFLNKSREFGRKAFFQNFVYVFLKDIDVSFKYDDPPVPTTNLEELPESKEPVHGGNGEVRENMQTWNQLLAESTPFVFLASYNVEVRDKEGRIENRELVIRLNVLHLAMKFMVAYTCCASADELFSASKDVFRILYMIALAFRECIMLQVHKTRTAAGFSQTPERNNVGRETNARMLRLSTLYKELLTEGQGNKPGELPQHLSTMLKEKLTMSLEAFEQLHDPPRKSSEEDNDPFETGSHEVDDGDGDDDIEDCDVDDDVVMMEIYDF